MISLKRGVQLKTINIRSFIIRNITFHVNLIVCLLIDKFHIFAYPADLLCTDENFTSS